MLQLVKRVYNTISKNNFTLAKCFKKRLDARTTEMITITNYCRTVYQFELMYDRILKIRPEILAAFSSAIFQINFADLQQF